MRPTPPSQVRPLHLPTPGSFQRQAPRPGGRPKRRRPPSRLKQLAIGMVCVVGSALILMALMGLAERLNTLLLVSQAVANLIRGLSLLAIGLLQLLALLLVAAMALLALLLLLGGLTRLLRLLAGGWAGAGRAHGQGKPSAKALSRS
ncbi:MAG: hypothetical protein VKP70_12010 [Cyanobacteriota bacterium]|nr:hypothetical protein [Cyanobacteriota bacterium]